MKAHRNLLCGAAALLLAPVAHAQDKPDRGTGTGGSLSSAVDGVGGPARSEETLESPSAPAQALSDIVVTARRRSESVQRVPIAVSVASSEALQDHQIVDAYQLATISPSLQVQSTNGQVGATNFSVRGIGTSVYGPQVESSVGVVIDDVAMSRPQFGAIQFFDIDRVEVLRGPQGMLFGKNASAGLVNIVTAAPQIGVTRFLAHAQYGNMNTPNSGTNATLEAAVNLPIGDTSAVRFTGFVSRKDGYVRNVGRDEDLGMTEFGGRAKLLWKPSEHLNFVLAGDYIHEEGAAESAISRRFVAPGGFIAGRNAIDGIVASPRNDRIASDAPTLNEFDLGGVSLRGELELGGGYSLTNIAAYRDFRSRAQLDTDQTSVDLFNTNAIRFNFRQVSDELRLASPSGDRLSYQVGLYYLNLRAAQDVLQGANLSGLAPAVPAGLSFTGARFKPVSRTNSGAAFFEGRFKVLDALRVTGGIRYTHDDLDYRITLTNPAAVLPLYALGTFRGSTKNDNVSYRFGADLDLAADVLIYATYARGYKGPTFDQLTATSVGEEIPKSYEVGLKSTIFDRRLRLNLAIFDTTFGGFQAQVRTPTSAAGFLTVNAGSLKSRGVELEFAVLPFAGLSITGGTTYNHTKYVGFAGVPCYFSQPAGTSGTNVCLPDGTTDVSGNMLANAPRWSTSITTRYEQDVFNGWKGFAQADVYHRSAFNYSPTKDPRTRIDANAILGASIGVESRDGRYTLSIFGRNLTDRRIPSFILADPLSANYANTGGTDASRGGNYLQQLNDASYRQIGVSLGLRM